MKNTTKIILASILGFISLVLTVIYFVLPKSSDTNSPIINEPTYTFSDPNFLKSAKEEDKQNLATYLSNYFSMYNLEESETNNDVIINATTREDSYDEYTSEDGITTATFILDVENPKTSLIISYSWGSDKIDSPFNVFCLPNETCLSTQSENAHKVVSIYNLEHFLDRGLTKEELQNLYSYLHNHFKENSPLTYRLILNKSSIKHNNNIYTATLTTESDESYTLEYNQSTKAIKLS